MFRSFMAPPLVFDVALASACLAILVVGLLTVAALLVGLVLGIRYGWGGAQSLFGAIEFMRRAFHCGCLAPSRSPH